MKKIITLVLALALSLCACLSLTACGKKIEDEKYVKANGKIVVGITDYKPMDYKEDGSDKWIGFDAELAEMFAKSLDVECEFLELSDWNKKTIEIDSKNIDLIWNGMTADDELGKSIDFSVSYAKNFQCAVIKKADAQTINSIDTIKAQSIAVEKGSAGQNVSVADLEKAEDELTTVDSQVKALVEVMSGSSKVAIIDYTLAQSVVGKGDYESLQIIDITKVKFSEEVFAVGLRKNSDLKEALDKFLKEKFNDGTMTELLKKYPEVVINQDALSK